MNWFQNVMFIHQFLRSILLFRLCHVLIHCFEPRQKCFWHNYNLSYSKNNHLRIDDYSSSLKIFSTRYMMNDLKLLLYLFFMKISSNLTDRYCLNSIQSPDNRYLNQPYYVQFLIIWKTIKYYAFPCKTCFFGYILDYIFCFNKSTRILCIFLMKNHTHINNNTQLLCPMVTGTYVHRNE